MISVVLRRSKDLGLCYLCGNRNSNDKTSCDSCIAKAKIRNDKRLDILKKDGICFVCKGVSREGRTRCQTCADKHAVMVNRGILQNKLLVFTHYGNRCQSCGITDPRVFNIDHVNNNGAQYRRKNKTRRGTHFYRQIIKDNYPKDLQILCFNCNWIKYLDTLKKDVMSF